MFKGLAIIFTNKYECKDEEHDNGPESFTLCLLFEANNLLERRSFSSIASDPEQSAFNATGFNMNIPNLIKL